jgi:eukaryotic-like serine/threonine-protein kinase
MTICKNLIFLSTLFLILAGPMALLGCGGNPQPRTEIRTIDGKVMVEIPAGEFRMGLDLGQQASLINQASLGRLTGEEESPQFTLSSRSFYIDQTPVTNAEYKKFLDAYPERAVPYVDNIVLRAYNWDQATRTFPAQQDHLPVVLVTWHDAVAYCQWAGKRLPTESEWEKAARGTDGRLWPWGNEWDSSKVSPGEPGTTRIPAVGQSPAGSSPFGVLDTVGIIWQWTSSLDKPYPYHSNDGREGQNTPGLRVTRGGAWGFTANVNRTTTRNPFDPSAASLSIGFRCAQ